jgi:hypothetical protein
MGKNPVTGFHFWALGRVAGRPTIVVGPARPATQPIGAWVAASQKRPRPPRPPGHQRLIERSHRSREQHECSRAQES